MMSKNALAFPNGNGGGQSAPGMSMRAYIATEVMAAMVSSYEYLEDAEKNLRAQHLDGDALPAFVADMSVRFADALIDALT